MVSLTMITGDGRDVSRYGNKPGVEDFKPNLKLSVIVNDDRLGGLVVRVLGYRSGGPGSIPGTTRKKSTGS
jgi:hypothetical protein